MEGINNVGNDYGIMINLKNTKYLVTEKDVNSLQYTLIINNSRIKRIRSCLYLEKIINEENDNTIEIKTCDLQLRLCTVHCYIFTLLFEFCVYHKILKIFWLDKINNNEVI